MGLLLSVGQGQALLAGSLLAPVREGELDMVAEKVVLGALERGPGHGKAGRPRGVRRRRRRMRELRPDLGPPADRQVVQGDDRVRPGGQRYAGEAEERLDGGDHEAVVAVGLFEHGGELAGRQGRRSVGALGGIVVHGVLSDCAFLCTPKVDAVSSDRPGAPRVPASATRSRPSESDRAWAGCAEMIFVTIAQCRSAIPAVRIRSTGGSSVVSPPPLEGVDIDPIVEWESAPLRGALLHTCSGWTAGVDPQSDGCQGGYPGETAPD